MAIFLNGYQVELSSPTFTASVLDVPDPAEMRRFRAAHDKDWFLYWRDGKAYALPRVAAPSTCIGEERQLETTNHDHLHILTARLNDVLPAKFPWYEAFRKRPYSFLGQKDEIVALVTRTWNGLSPLVKEFEIRPRFELDPRLVEIHKDETVIGLFMKVAFHWSILAPVNQLRDAGLDLAGLHVVHRNPGQCERRLVGTIAEVGGNEVLLSEAYEDLRSIPVQQVWLEGSRASFARCLRHLLGSRYEEFEAQWAVQEGNFLLGPALDSLLRKMEDLLRKASPIVLTEDLEARVTGRLEVTNREDYQAVTVSPPVEYCFDAAKAKRHEIPWAGLVQYGPFSRDTFSKRTPRLLVVCPDQAVGKVSQFLKSFRDGIQSLADSRYRKGFSGTFGLVNPEFVTCPVPLLGTSDTQLADLYRRTIETHLAGSRDPYDAALVAILDNHGRLPDALNPYIYSKATLLLNGIPAQEIRFSTLTARHESLQWTMQNLAIAVYAKMGGIPWTVAHDLTVDDELVVGMGVAELSGSRFEARQRFVGITTVFRGDGNYLLSNISRVSSYDEYPELLQRSTVEVLNELKQRNGWRDGDTVRVVFHIHKPLKKVETAQIVERCVREVGCKQNIEFAFLTVSHDHPFKVLNTSQAGKATRNGVKGRFAPDRGTITQLGRYTRLLSTNGPNQIKRATTPLPTPVLIHLHRESSYRDLQYLTEQALKFTSLTWRSTQPAYTPVTIYYSELIAALLARLQVVPDWSPSVLNTKLRFSRWFL
jgi:hypothetical protein